MATTWGQISNILVASATKKRVPVIGQFELTSRCNLKCKMCYVCQPANDKNVIARERKPAEWVRLAEEARDAGVLYLLLTGGEVFLRQDFKEIYEPISQMGFSTTIYSNATMVTSELAKWLGRIPPAKISVTLYGASPEMYKRICGFEDGFERTLRGIDLLLDAGIVVSTKMTVVQGNKDELEKLAEYAEKRNLDFGIVDTISPRREGCITDPAAERLSPAEYVDFQDRVEKYFRPRKKQSGNPDKQDGATEDLEKLLEAKMETDDPGEAFQCAGGRCGFWVTWDGRMSPCGLMDNPVSFPFEKGFSAAWEELKSLCGTVPVCKECRQCEHKDSCNPCPARLITETGHFDKPAPYFCEIARRQKEARLSAKI